jgi:hypothetical protein
MITAWLASKLGKIIVLVLAVLGLVMTPAAIIQTVRINGISFFGLYAVDGYKPMYERADRANATLRGNQDTLKNAVKKCNASVDDIKTESDRLTIEVQHLVALAARLEGQLSGNIAAMKAIKSTTEKCPVADAILTRGFQ